jgi:ribosome-binding factor A
MPNRRQEKVAERIHQEISTLLLLESKDPRLANVNVVDVVVSPDLRLAKVHVSALGTPEEAKEAIKGLEHASGYLRRQVAQRLGLRFAPELTFTLDESWQHGARVDELLNQLRSAGAGGGSMGPSIAATPGRDGRDDKS